MSTTNHTTRRTLIAAALGLAATHGPLANLGRARAGAQEAGSHCLVIEHVTVLSMAPGVVPQEDMTVLIQGERITTIEPTTHQSSPAGCTVIDGRGKWLMPGLFDMHVHFMSEPIPELAFTPEEILTPYLANGVLQILDMAATPDTNAIRDAVATGEIVAPFVASAALIDGFPPILPGARVVANPEAARAAVAEIAAAGFDFVKVYSRLTPEVFAAILAAAENEDIRVIGHIPGNRKVPPAELVQPGFALIAHAEELSWLAPDKSDAEIAQFTTLLREHTTAITSTLFLDEQILAQTRNPEIVAATEGLAYLHPVELMLWFEENRYSGKRTPERIARLETLTAFNARLVKALVEAGVPVLAGADAAFVPGVAPGYALHQELAALVAAGLTPWQALAAATSVPAEWLGVSDDRGTVEAGKRANLILLDADPLADIGNTRAINAVIFNGELFDRQVLDARLAALDALYAPYRPFFSPQGARALAQQGRP
ncbi:MAG: amidohydrolase family protein [Thermomicrobiales bacterium]